MSATVQNTKHGGYYHFDSEEEAQAVCDEWNEGLGRAEWRLLREGAQ